MKIKNLIPDQTHVNGMTAYHTPPLADRYVTRANVNSDGTVYQPVHSDGLDATPGGQHRMNLIGRFRLRGWPYWCFLLGLLTLMIPARGAGTITIPFSWQYPTNGYHLPDLGFRIWISGDQKNWSQLVQLTNAPLDLQTTGVVSTNIDVGTNNFPAFFAVTSVMNNSVTNYVDSPFGNLVGWPVLPPIKEPVFSRLTNSLDTTQLPPWGLILGTQSSGGGGGGSDTNWTVLSNRIIQDPAGRVVRLVNNGAANRNRYIDLDPNSGTISIHTTNDLGNAIGTIYLYTYTGGTGNTNFFPAFEMYDDAFSKYIVILDPTGQDGESSRYLYDTTVNALSSGLHTVWRNNGTDIASITWDGAFNTSNTSSGGPGSVAQPFKIGSIVTDYLEADISGTIIHIPTNTSSGITINPTTGSIPVRTSSTAFGDSPIFVTGLQSISMPNGTNTIMDLTHIGDDNNFNLYNTIDNFGTQYSTARFLVQTNNLSFTIAAFRTGGFSSSAVWNVQTNQLNFIGGVDGTVAIYEDPARDPAAVTSYANYDYNTHYTQTNTVPIVSWKNNGALLHTVTVDGAITTAQSSGNGSGQWKLGKNLTGLTVSLVVTNAVEVMIDGVVRKLALVQ